jgi:hypothetical protein
MILRLTDAELADITGYTQPAAQIRWLKKYGIRVFIAADGHPRVLRSDLETAKNQPRAAANLAALTPRRSL